MKDQKKTTPKAKKVYPPITTAEFYALPAKPYKPKKRKKFITRKSDLW